MKLTQEEIKRQYDIDMKNNMKSYEIQSKYREKTSPYYLEDESNPSLSFLAKEWSNQSKLNEEGKADSNKINNLIAKTVWELNELRRQRGESPLKLNS